MEPKIFESGQILQSSLFPEKIKITSVMPMGSSLRLSGEGLSSGKAYSPILTPDQFDQIQILSTTPTFDGNAREFKLAIEALRIGLAYEHDPFFSLSISRVDPLPHQLEAVYHYFLKLPRIRFLLADDPGAGKTIMAGLLLKELKIRGLVKRCLIITPANLTFQWQRELKDKFREQFEVIGGQLLRSNYGSNPWQDKSHLITSISWVSRIDDARESLFKSHWDLIIVDEAHKMSAYEKRKTLAYQLGEALSDRTDHFLLMTATPHKGDPINFSKLLELLDKDVYGNISSLEEAIKNHRAPFYLRRTKEALVTFPDPETGEVKRIFTRRNVQTIEFQIDHEEGDFYQALTRYVEEQCQRAKELDSSKARALSFNMAMLQRRFASSIRAVKESLIRMKKKREEILQDPEEYRKKQIEKRLPEDFEEYPEEEQDQIIEDIEGIVASVDKSTLRMEISELEKLIDQATLLEKREVEAKLTKLKEVLKTQGIFDDPKMKLLLFTEHKDTLIYLVKKLEDWELKVTQIHGGMKVGDRDTPNTRIHSERIFREDCQVMVATEAAGEGINLQFCWFMINYDIPWNPVRLEQRMGRIHRYGQEKDCLIFNFVSTNTREGRVFQRLFERIQKIEQDLDPQKTGKIFNVLGDIFPSNEIESMLRDMYARSLTEKAIEERIVKDLDVSHFQNITNSTLEGLAKRELNLSRLVSNSAEAKEKRLVPEVIEDFFRGAAPIVSVEVKNIRGWKARYNIPRIPTQIRSLAERLEPQFGPLGKEYKKVVFDQKTLSKDATLEWITPGHPLFESVRQRIIEVTENSVEKGCILWDLHTPHPYGLIVFTGAIQDGKAHLIHKKLFVVQIEMDGAMRLRRPTVFLDLLIPSSPVKAPHQNQPVPQTEIENFILANGLNPLLKEVQEQREKEIRLLRDHTEISLNALINHVQCQYAELFDKKESGADEKGIAGRLVQTEERLEELNQRLENKRKSLDLEKQCHISNLNLLGQAWVLPHPDRESPQIAPMVRDEEIERIAIQTVIQQEEAQGFQVESVEDQNRGFDLLSRKLHPENPEMILSEKFIEVKGRAREGDIALTSNEYKTAQRLRENYWLYVVFHCATKPKIIAIQDPAQLGWKPIVKIEHYQVDSKEILGEGRS